MKTSKVSFARLARAYLRTLDGYRDAKTAVAVALRIGQDTRDLEHEAARVQATHQNALRELVSAAAQLRGTGAA